MARMYQVLYRDGCLEILEAATIVEARAEAQERWKSPIKKIVAIQDPCSECIPSSLGHLEEGQTPNTEETPKS